MTAKYLHRNERTPLTNMEPLPCDKQWLPDLSLANDSVEVEPFNFLPFFFLSFLWIEHHPLLHALKCVVLLCTHFPFCTTDGTSETN